jgi:hypothetical protein
MKNEPGHYTESHNVSLNVFLIFYVYIMFILIAANLAPVSATGYFIFFPLGLAGLCLLFIRAAYKITVRKNILEISINIFSKIVFLRLDIKKIERVEELKIKDVTSSFKIAKNSPGSISYLIKTPKAIKVSVPGKKTYIISTADPDRLINLIKSINK